MAIKDITNLMTLYSQPTSFDRDAWRTAQSIADGFTQLKNNNIQMQRNQQMLQQGQLQQQLTNQQIEASNWLSQNQYDTTGRLLNPEELFNLAITTGNPTLINSLVPQLKSFYQSEQQRTATLDPNIASVYGYQSGNTGYYLNNGTAVNGQTGLQIGEPLNPTQQISFNGINTQGNSINFNAMTPYQQWQVQQAQQKAEIEKNTADLNTAQKAIGDLINNFKRNNPGVDFTPEQMTKGVGELLSIYQGNQGVQEQIRAIYNNYMNRQQQAVKANNQQKVSDLYK